MSNPRVPEFTAVLRRLSVMFTRIASDQCAEQNTFSKQELSAIDMLGIQGSSRMGDIAHHLGIVQSAVTQLVDRLENRGVAERVRSAEDRRVWLVALTKKGDTVYHGLDAFYDTVSTRMLAPLTEKERTQLVSLLTRVESDLDSK